MCIEVNADYFTTVHHELGHNFYQRAYNKQPFLFRNGANDGFHEAIGDSIALSITPAYLKTLGLTDDRAAGRSRHSAAAAHRARQGRVPALRPGSRQVALAGLLRRDQARRLQQGLVGAAREVPGRRAAGRAHRSRLRCRRQEPHPHQRSLRALLPRAHLPVPVLQGDVRRQRLQGPAEPLQLLRLESRRREARTRCSRPASRNPGSRR